MAVMFYLPMFISLYEELGICSGFSVTLLQESSILEENVTLRQNTNVREVFTIVTMKTVVGCDIMQSGRSLQSFAPAVCLQGNSLQLAV
jgi:hypothetical protein